MKRTNRKLTRRYTPQQKAEALALVDCAASISEAARISGVPEQTLNEWARGKYVPPGIQALREQKREDLASAFEDIAWRAIGQLKDRGIDQAKPGELNAIAGTAIDKMRLLRSEEPTASEPERSAAEAIRACAEMVVRMAEMAGRKLTVEQVERRIREIQVERCKFTVVEETTTRARN